MPLQDKADVALSIFKSFDAKSFTEGLKAVSDDCVIVEVSNGDSFVGPTGLQRQYDKWARAFPDGRSEVKNVFTSGDWVAIESVWHGTHDGPWESPVGVIPASGNTISFSYSTIARIVDGLEVEERHYFDDASILRQMGVQQ
jgi:steroid delta-isomerase-like uncharacterized protein